MLATVFLFFVHNSSSSTITTSIQNFSLKCKNVLPIIVVEGGPPKKSQNLALKITLDQPPSMMIYGTDPCAGHTKSTPKCHKTNWRYHWISNDVILMFFLKRFSGGWWLLNERAIFLYSSIAVFTHQQLSYRVDSTEIGMYLVVLCRYLAVE